MTGGEKPAATRLALRFRRYLTRKIDSAVVEVGGRAPTLQLRDVLLGGVVDDDPLVRQRIQEERTSRNAVRALGRFRDESAAPLEVRELGEKGALGTIELPTTEKQRAKTCFVQVDHQSEIDPALTGAAFQLVVSRGALALEE